MVRSGHRLGGLVVFCVVSLLWWSVDVAIGQAQTPLNVLIRVPPSSGLMERVAGQVSDLPVVLHAVAEADVRVTVGVSALEPSGWHVEVHDHARAQTDTRDVLADPSRAHSHSSAPPPTQQPMTQQPMTQSALDEAAALVIRSMLQSILQQDAQPPIANPPITTTPEPTELPSAVEAPEIDVPRVPVANAPVTRLWLALGSQLALGDRDAGLYAGLAGIVGIQHRAFALGLQAGYGLAVRYEDPVADITTARHSLHVIGRVDVAQLGDNVFSLLGSVGTHVFTRHTERVAAGWQVTDDAWVWSPGVGLAGQWRILLVNRLALGVTVGADLLTQVPTLRTRTLDGRRHTLATGLWLSPRAGIALEFVL